MPYSLVSIVGLGINYATKQLFVTRNGTLMGTLGKKLRNLMHLHPTVGINKVDNKCRVNFGQKPFEFDLVSYLNQLDTDEQIAARWPQKLYSQVSKCHLQLDHVSKCHFTRPPLTCI
jgi:hypothetical protein